MRVGGPIVTDNSEAGLRLAIAGAGIIRIGDMLVSKAVREGQLTEIALPYHEPEEWSTWAVFPPGMQRIPRVRVFLEFLHEQYANAPWSLAHANARA